MKQDYPVDTAAIVRHISERIWKNLAKEATGNGVEPLTIHLLEGVVDFALHGQNKHLFDKACERNRKNAIRAAGEAVSMSDKLVQKEPAVVMLFWGIDRWPQNPKLTRDGALEEWGAKIFDVHLHRRFEFARRKVRESESEIQDGARKRLKSFGELGFVSKRFPEKAARSPDVYRLLDRMHREMIGARKNTTTK